MSFNNFPEKAKTESRINFENLLSIYGDIHYTISSRKNLTVSKTK